ncbi:MAG: hypothetical protein RSE07_02395 [Oscillospiraceae bacterium]
MTNDVFIEQIVKRKTTGKYVAYKILICLGGMILSLCAIPMLMSKLFAPFALLVFIAGFYLAWYFVTMLDVEFEYIYTNGEIDIDKISGKRKRIRLTTVKVSSFELFEKYSESNCKNNKYDITLMCSDDIKNPDNYCATYHGKGGKHCLLIFAPQENMLEQINRISRLTKFNRG